MCSNWNYSGWINKPAYFKLLILCILFRFLLLLESVWVNYNFLENCFYEFLDFGIKCSSVLLWLKISDKSTLLSSLLLLICFFVSSLIFLINLAKHLFCCSFQIEKFGPFSPLYLYFLFHTFLLTYFIVLSVIYMYSLVFVSFPNHWVCMLS